MHLTLAQEPVEQPVPRPARRWSARQTDRKLDGAVNVYTLMIDMIPEPVDIPVPTGFANAKKSIGNTPPLVRQMMSEADLSTDEVVVAYPKSRDTFVGEPTSTAPKIAGLTVNLAGDVTAGVASLAELAEDVTASAGLTVNLAGDVTADVASSADLAKDVTAGVASLADLAEVVTAGVTPSVDPDGDVTAGVTSMEEYKERDVVLSDVVLPQTDPDESPAELETIVVCAVGTGAPWFLTGWAEGTEIEFMIDTGCRATRLRWWSDASCVCLLRHLTLVSQFPEWDQACCRLFPG